MQIYRCLKDNRYYEKISDLISTKEGTLADRLLQAKC
jgi:hypothetical protein